MTDARSEARVPGGESSTSRGTDPVSDHGRAALPRRPAVPLPDLDPDQRPGLRDRAPALDLRLPLLAAAVRRLRRLLLCARVAHLQDVLRAQAARPARARHPAAGERAGGRRATGARVSVTQAHRDWLTHWIPTNQIVVNRR